MKLVIEIPGLPPAVIRGNVHPINPGTHWARQAAAQQWGATAHYAIIDARNRAEHPPEWRDLTKAHAHVTYLFPTKRRIDLDNLEGQAMKPVWDALVRVGVLVDDCWTMLSHSYEGKLDKRGPMTIVEITAKEER